MDQGFCIESYIKLPIIPNCKHLHKSLKFLQNCKINKLDGFSQNRQSKKFNCGFKVSKQALTKTKHFKESDIKHYLCWKVGWNGEIIKSNLK